MTSIYHGGAKIEKEVTTPLFLYKDISDSIYFATGYSGAEKPYVSEFKVNNYAKVLDLCGDEREQNERFLNELMKKHGLVAETEYQLIKDSYETVGREVYAHDIELALYPQIREDLLKVGFNVLKNYSVMENTQPIGYAVLDSSVLEFKREYQVTSDSENVYLKVSKDNTATKENSTLGKSYTGQTGYGDITLEEVNASPKKKKM